MSLLPRQRGNVSLSNLRVLKAILYVAEHGVKVHPDGTGAQKKGPQAIGIYGPPLLQPLDFSSAKDQARGKTPRHEESERGHPALVPKR